MTRTGGLIVVVLLVGDDPDEITCVVVLFIGTVVSVTRLGDGCLIEVKPVVVVAVVVGDKCCLIKLVVIVDVCCVVVVVVVGILKLSKVGWVFMMGRIMVRMVGLYKDLEGSGWFRIVVVVDGEVCSVFSIGVVVVLIGESLIVGSFMAFKLICEWI